MTYFKIQLLTIVIFIYSMTATGQAKIKLTVLDKAKLPGEIIYEKYEGLIKNAVQWTDKNGVNMVITTETGEYQYENAGGGASLYAYHYLVNNGHAALTWKVSDFIKDCPVDIETRYIENTFQVTDLNKNGIYETWLMYVTACHGDVSPLDMKIIMYEGMQKYAMRGQNKIQYSPSGYMGGEYKFDKAFTEGPSAFRDFAKKMWGKHITGK